MPAIRVNSPSFSFAPCVCLPATRVDSSQSLHACDSVRALWLMPEIDLRRLQNQPSEAPKSSPDRPEAAQSATRAFQVPPKSAQERPKSAPRGSRSAPGSSSRRSRETSGTILTLLSSKKCFPRAIRSATHFRRDFGTIFHSFTSRVGKGRKSSDMRLDS